MEKRQKHNNLEEQIDRMNQSDIYTPNRNSFKRKSLDETKITHIDEVIDEKYESEFQIFVAHFKKSWYYFILLLCKFMKVSVDSVFAAIYYIIIFVLKLLGFLFQIVFYILKFLLKIIVYIGVNIYFFYKKLVPSTKKIYPFKRLLT